MCSAHSFEQYTGRGFKPASSVIMKDTDPIPVGIVLSQTLLQHKPSVVRGMFSSIVELRIAATHHLHDGVVAVRRAYGPVVHVVEGGGRVDGADVAPAGFLVHGVGLSYSHCRR